ncbi:MAG: response regulator [Limisphaerales bacterium]
MSATHHQHPPTIFIVDDEPMLLDLAQTLLVPLGFDVRVYSDPRKALAEFAAARPSLVITDYAMGGLNGMDVLRECRKLNPRQKVVLLSGTVDESIFANDSYKPDHFLAKPYQVRDFVELVQKLITD